MGKLEEIDKVNAEIQTLSNKATEALQVRFLIVDCRSAIGTPCKAVKRSKDIC